MEALRKLARRIASSPRLTTIRPAVLAMDKILLRLTSGRITVIRMAGLPSLTLIVKGRKTGIPRQIPLLYVPDGPDCLLVGSNWGGPSHPMWTANLLANPDASVNVAGRTRDVTARLLTGDEREAIWSHLTKTWPVYDVYQAKTAREIRVFRLIPLHPDRSRK